jgi:hypothetical protein
MADMDAKGRRARGMKLTDDDVRKIRALRLQGLRYEQIGIQFGVIAGYVKTICAHRARRTA